jgi:hypothetical protein
MTGARQPEKSQLRRRLLFSIVFAGFAAFCRPANGAEPPIVVNSDTGLALSGVDPVAYFAEGKPVFGRADVELSRFGTVWRFRNVGNRTAFTENPEIYMPQFGGYDPVGIGRGRAIAGHPLIWTITGERLYLFYSEADRTAFLADAARIIAAAQRRWPEVARTAGR